MLAFLAAFLITLSGARAQTNTEYSFRQQSVADGQGYNGNGDPVPVLSMDCLAANGYGQWTLSSQPGQGNSALMGSGATLYPPGWYLLANGLYAPSTHYDGSDIAKFPECIPPGVVQNGTFASSSNESRVVANLNGTTVYIWPDPATRTSFVIQEFTPENIDISIAPGFPNSALSRQVVKSGPETPTSVTTEYPAGSGTYYSVASNEADYRDECDFAIDASYLYVTWCHENSFTPFLRTVYVAAYDLNTWALVTGYPIAVAQGWRPRLACDVRNSGTPRFDLAWIASETNYPDGAPMWLSYVGTTSTRHTISYDFLSPIDGSLTQIQSANRVCPLVSSVYGTNGAGPLGGSEHHALYVAGSQFPYATVSDELIFINEDNPNISPGDAAYVDGPLITWASPDGLLPGGEHNTVVDHWIEAFANPYDNGDNMADIPPDWREYDQFHCVYQDVVTFNYEQHSALVIVRGSDNGSNYPPPLRRNPDNTPVDTRLVLNQVVPVPLNPNFLEDPSSYIAAVNQMGIHVHWHTASGLHYYARDLNRTFDEDITENTLVTDQCTVSDGTAHGGLAGATTTGSTQMTVWTDPNYGPPNLDGTYGLYQPRTLSTLNPYVGTLNFPDANTKLQVGDGSTDANGVPYQSTLAVMPFFYFNVMEDIPGALVGLGVTVEPNCVFDYYGLNATHDNTGAITDSATPFTDGTADGVGQGRIDLEGGWVGDGAFPIRYYAYMNVHGGADFYLGARNSFKSHDASTTFEYESDLYPVNTSTNPSNSGLITVFGAAVLDTSVLTGNYPVYTGPPDFVKQYIIRVASSTGQYPSPFPQWTSTGDLYANFVGGGVSKIRIEGNLAGTANDVTFNGDYLNGAVISGADLHSGMYIGYCTFVNSIDPAIWLKQSSLTEPYGIQWIQNNTFGKYDPLSNNPYVTEGRGTVELDNFGAENVNWIQITDNHFTTNNSQNDPSDDENAIGLSLSTASVLNNEISDSESPAFAEGVDVVGLNRANANHSLICHNSFRYLAYDDAIEALEYDGYIKLNEMAWGEDGLDNYGDVTCHFDFNYVHDNYGPGINLPLGGGVDMTGVHFDPFNATVGDLAGFNTIMYNGIDGGDPQIYDDNDGLGDPAAPIWLGQGSSWDGSTQATWTVFGENNIMHYPGWPNVVLIQGGGNPISRDMSNNYWDGHDPNTSDSTTYWPNFLFNAPVTILSDTSSIWSIQVSCGNDTLSGNAEKEDNKPLGQLIDTTLDSCDYAEEMAYVYSEREEWQPAFDTIRWYVEHCYMLAGYDQLWAQFGNIEAGVLKGAPEDSLAMRDWLISVRHLNPAGGWYCDVVEAITGTYLNDFRALLAITKFLIDNPRCAGNITIHRLEYNNLRGAQWGVWSDTVKDPKVTPFDTTLPTLHDLGLDSLLEDAASGVHYEAAGTQIILDARITTNPFPQVTSLHLSIGREAYLNITVFDMLGRKVDGAGYAGVFEPGVREIPLNLSSAPSGAYYVRIATANNEVRTLKITKE